MPRPNKRVLSESDDGEGQGSDGSIDPPAKTKNATVKDESGGASKSKKSRPSENSGAASVAVEENEEGDEYFKFSEYRRLTVRTFKSKTLIDIRDMYKDKTTGATKPGAKGISLTPEQWDLLKSNIATVDDMVAKVNEK
nr:uncharacterized protein CI109_006756 [Kwoniella shandongensis]KAA5524885.1 hypothetical protein CI109_006756 [Kwoniella shandongensis]